MINKTCDRVLTNERVSDLVRMIKECEPKQSIMHLTFGYSFLKQAGSFFFTCCLLGQKIKTDSSLDINLIHLINTLLTVVEETINLNARSSLMRPNFNFISVKRNSCSKSSFRPGHGRRYFGKTMPGSS